LFSHLVRENWDVHWDQVLWSIAQGQFSGLRGVVAA
jgi:hypothetical protein